MTIETLSKDISSWRHLLYRVGDGAPTASQKHAAAVGLLTRIESFRDGRVSLLGRVDAGEYGFTTPADAVSQRQRLVTEVAQAEEWIVDLRQALAGIGKEQVHA